tara:strand:- start:183 stop:548 length:366 start_codon:yes stop_codon:yes gene_type:complete
MVNNLYINLKKNKSLKFYLNYMPINIIKIINNNIEFKKKYKIKKHIKLNKKVLRQIKYKVKLHRTFIYNNIMQYWYIKVDKNAIHNNYKNIYYKNHINKSNDYIISLFDINKKYIAYKKLK